jgi:hypothetical protein
MVDSFSTIVFDIAVAKVNFKRIDFIDLVLAKN